jgi:heterodisulfide reductase subunit A
MDIRTFGKGYEQFYQSAKAMGIEFVKGKVARITEDAGRNPTVRVELVDENRVVEREHDLVVLSTGMLPGANTEVSFGVPVSQDGFVSIPRYHIAPTVTTQAGVFATGTATGPMDIVDSIMTSGAAAAEAAAYLQAHNIYPTDEHRKPKASQASQVAIEATAGEANERSLAYA